MVSVMRVGLRRSKTVRDGRRRSVDCRFQIGDRRLQIGTATKSPIAIVNLQSEIICTLSSRLMARVPWLESRARPLRDVS